MLRRLIAALGLALALSGGIAVLPDVAPVSIERAALKSQAQAGHIGTHRALLGGPSRSNSAQVQQFFNRLATVQTPARQALYRTAINRLVAAGVWVKLDALWLYAAADSGTSFVNLVSSQFYSSQWTASGSPTFTVDRGWTSVGINANVNTNYNPTSAAGQCVQNSCFWAAFNRTVSTGLAQPLIIPESGATGNLELWPRYTDTKTYWDLNGSAEQSATNVATDTSGWFYLVRTASNATAVWRNDVQIATASNASAAPINENVHFQGNTFQVAAGAVGLALSTSEKTELYNAVLGYLQGVGASP